jgi:phage shock protein E
LLERSTSAEATSTAGRPATYTTVDVLTTFDALKADAGAQLVDVREPEEWTATGVPPGALLIPPGEIEARASAELAPDRPVYVICRSGNRSRTASETLIKLGYTEVYNVEGGIQAWLNAGLPVVPYGP